MPALPVASVPPVARTVTYRSRAMITPLDHLTIISYLPVSIRAEKRPAATLHGALVGVDDPRADECHRSVSAPAIPLTNVVQLDPSSTVTTR